MTERRKGGDDPGLEDLQKSWHALLRQGRLEKEACVEAGDKLNWGAEIPKSET